MDDGKGSVLNIPQHRSYELIECKFTRDISAIKVMALPHAAIAATSTLSAHSSLLQHFFKENFFFLMNF